MKLEIDVKTTMQALLSSEDTTGSYTITVEDTGSKKFQLIAKDGTVISVFGTYHLGNLLQELAIAQSDEIEIDYIFEEPITRLSRIIKEHHWNVLTRKMDAEGLLKVLEDEKMQGDKLYVYVPESDPIAFDFYQKITKNHQNISLEIIPEKMTGRYLKTLHENPGILTLSFDKISGESAPFVVPGGRFNEMYGWDSYFIGIGLMIDDEFDVTKGMIDNLEYQIVHYGKILNANRNYYLSRSQPPFFTSFVREFYEKYKNKLSKSWLYQKLTTAIKEYHNVWMRPNLRLTENKLNRYYGEGTGIPMETEKGHFDFILKKYAKKHEKSIADFTELYRKGVILEPELDLYFIHDRSMRESGHDTTSRLDNCSAHLNTVDLNSLLYKYETDIAYLINTYFDDTLEVNNTIMKSADWEQKAQNRKKAINALLWCETEATYYDYNFVKQTFHKTISVTNLYPLWAGLCNEEQAKKLIKTQLLPLVCKGGVASMLRKKEENHSEKPERQWDFPYGWAPHQMLTWKGLQTYGYTELCQQLIYRWLWLLLKTTVDYNGLIPEKFNVETCTHKVTAEYGNVGTGFKYISEGGFGWTNASFKLGIALLDARYVKALNDLKDPEELFK
ncbi:trehalase family glycosidase [Kordia zhangzhouensis]|uniref:trehalase family glycosidase n=1 Tax=Kordia zhangzhouensis TaxID=1620405 RepID=UPI0006298B1E|nr:trehalase family glycosidase [Kordia zhangzhouensis]